jgi:hypothetical protein
VQADRPGVVTVRAAAAELLGRLQDADPATTTDCTTGSPFAQQVRISEFQAFGH